MKKPLISLVTILLFCCNSANAKKTDFCKEYGLGWNFYCQEEQIKEEVTEKKSVKETPKNQEDYAAKLAEIKQVLEEKKAKAVIYPTEENIKDYMSYQQMVLDKSGTFADQWRRVLWKTPELDYTLKRPVSKVGKESWTDDRNSKIVGAIRGINNRYGVFFVFRSDCHFCHRYSPILKSFKEKYGIVVMPVSMDGGGLPEWEKFMVDHGQIERMGMEVKSVPATILFDKETRQIIPVGFGVLSHSDLEERIYAITKLEVGDDF